MSSEKPKVVVTHWVHPEVEDFMREFCSPIFNRTHESFAPEALLSHCRGADGMMVFMPDSIDEEFLRQCPNLRIIAGALKGYDNFNVGACSERGVIFTIVPDLLTVPTAELAIALLLGISRRCLEGDELIRSGKFEGWRPVLYGGGIEGRTVGIVGYGAVGKAFADRLVGFGCRIIATDEKEIEDSSVAAVGFDNLLEESDYVVLFIPLSGKTRHLFSDENLKKMKTGSILINVCRGSVVDEKAVAAVLKTGPLAGYAADVFEMEDWALEDRPRKIPSELLTNRKQTLFTPHLGSAVDDVRKKIALEAAMQLQAAFAGRVPDKAINPEAFVQQSGI